MNENEAVLVGLVVTVLAFILGRLLVLWYFKIDKRVEQNDEIIKLLKQLNNK
jgi:hypothetical protein